MGWCRVIGKRIPDITIEEINRKCIHPDFEYCDLCYFSSSIKGGKMTEFETYRVNKILHERGQKSG